MSRPFRFGVGALNLDLSAPDWQERVRRVERQGYSVLTIGDHAGMRVGGPIASLAAIAMATSTLRMGSYVLCNELRHPATVLRELITIDQISGGRLEVGLGAGWLETDFSVLGMSMDPVGLRLERLVEALEIFAIGFGGTGEVNHIGRHYTVTGFGVRPPAQRPRPPLVVGGGGPRVLAIAAAHADIVAINDNLAAGSNYLSKPGIGDGTWQSLLTKVSTVREAAGERFADLELGLLIKRVVVTDDISDAAETIARELSCTADEVTACPAILLGSVDGIAARVRELRERAAISYLTVGLPAADAFAPVVEMLSGA
jgi:probable F420-dependent oxidoreductase